MSTIQLSSYERARRYLAPEGETPLTDTLRRKGEIQSWIHAISRKIEKFLGRELMIEAHTEYFDVGYEQRVFWPKSYPVTTLTSVYSDISGEWEGDEVEESDPYIGVDAKSIVLQTALPFTGSRVLRAIYTGGMAYNGVQSTFSCTMDDTDTFTVGKFLIGGTSGALGIVRTVTADGGGTGIDTVVVENLYGVFESDETLTEYTYADDVADASAGASATGATGTLTTVTYQSLAESEYGDIVRAAEIELRHMYKHKLDFEMEGFTREGVNLRRRDKQPAIPFTEEAYALLLPYRRTVL